MASETAQVAQGMGYVFDLDIIRIGIQDIDHDT
jgi:hypothetical protein